MNEFLKILLSLSLSGTLLLLLIWCLKKIYGDKFSKCWQYYIWIIVAVRFLLPVTPDVSIIGTLFEKSGTLTAAGHYSAGFNMPVTINEDINASGQIQENKQVTTSASTHNPFHIYTVLFLLWAAPALALFTRKITLYNSFIRYIKATNTEISDEKVLSLLFDCESQLHVRRRNTLSASLLDKANVMLYHNEAIGSPMMIGFFRPGIMLPALELEDKELTYIFMHELTHYKRKDIFYKWLIQIVVCVHWFNPFVYQLEKEVNKCCELSCDEKVISALDDKARREYGDMLLSFLKSDYFHKRPFGSVTLTEGAAQLKERLGAIMNFRRKKKSVAIISLVTAFLLSFSGFILGAYAARPSLPTLPQKRMELAKQPLMHENSTEQEENKSISIIHESADILYYENGSPYIHDILTNHTNKSIVETEYCMSAYNENGAPLKLHWNFLDSSAESSYENIVWSRKNILPGQTESYPGGWSLYDDSYDELYANEITEGQPSVENDSANQVAYSLLCLKQVVFEDDTIWNNPNYEEWFQTYVGKKLDEDELQNYYPHQYELEIH